MYYSEAHQFMTELLTGNGSPHDDVMKLMCFPRYWLIVREIHWIFLAKASNAGIEVFIDWC